MFDFLKGQRIYLDHAATTPLDPKVLSVMQDAYRNNYVNPGGLYREGVEAVRIIDQSRKSVARLLGTTSDHIIFTRGGTESCNLGIMGVLVAHHQPHVITSSIEHAAVLEVLKDLEKKQKIELTIIPVDDQGIVIVDEIKKALKPETVLVSVMYVNNEIGTIQPIKEIAKLIRWHKKHAGSNVSLHVDAIQAANYLDINVERLGVDLMSLSGSKIYGPKSAGMLYVRNRELLSPVIYGGGQEFGLRAGTEDIAQIVGFSKALEITREISESENTRLEGLQEYFFAELEKNIQGIIMNGSREYRSPNNINITVLGISGERLVIELDAKGICASSKSACNEDSGEESHVIAALRQAQGITSVTTEGALRFTMGRFTAKRDIQRTVLVLSEIVRKIRVFEKTITK